MYIRCRDESQYLTTANLICNVNIHAKHSCGCVQGLQAPWCEVAELGARVSQQDRAQERQGASLHLQCLVVHGADGVPLGGGLPLALTGLIRQQVTFDVTESNKKAVKHSVTPGRG